MLELTGITKTFGGVKALQDVAMSVAPGEVRGLIGPNGAGKSTLVNVISGLLTHSAGTLTLDGAPLDGVSAQRRAENGIARTFQNLRVFSSLTVQQNIDVASYTGTASGRGGDALLHEAILRFDLADRLNEPASSLPYGQLRRLEIVRALALRPRVLMLDEPAAGMNEQETEALGEALGWVRDESDCSILVIDHDLKFIMALSERITVLSMGEVIADGTPQEVSENRQVIDAYLGEEEHAA
ncbi:ABC transporter ATP-binding protein [bacterium]|nr:ABC transporter ATP-binding protein [bacterium]